MTSHELSTIQQHNQLQEWLQSCPGYVEPDLEGLNSTFRVAYLPVHSWKGGKRSTTTARAIAHLERDAQRAERIREMTKQGCGITEIQQDLKVDSRRVHAIAKEFNIQLQSKFTQRIEGLKEAGRRYRAQWLDAVRDLAAQGLTVDAIAKAAGCGRHVVERLIKEHNISRGKRRKE